MNSPLNITLSFSPEDLEEIRERGTSVPNFWAGHPTGPNSGDLVRFGGMQYSVLARCWEHDGKSPVLRLYMSEGKPDTGTAFH